MTVVVVGVNNLERRDRTESRELLNEGEGGGNHSLGGNDRSQDSEDPGNPPVSSTGTSGNRLEEDVLNDGFRIGDETSSLTEIGEEETRVDESSEGETNRVLAELTETVSEEEDQRVSFVKTGGVVSSLRRLTFCKRQQKTIVSRYFCKAISYRRHSREESFGTSDTEDDTTQNVVVLGANEEEHGARGIESCGRGQGSAKHLCRRREGRRACLGRYQGSEKR